MSKDEKRQITDLTGVARLAESELARDIYSDALQPSLAKAGGLTLDGLETLQKLLSPAHTIIRGAAERVDRWAARVFERVPEDERTEADPKLAVPLVQALVRVPEESVLKDLFLNLLEKAITKSTSHNAHPAFVATIDSLSSSEALLLILMKRIDPIETESDYGYHWNGVPTHEYHALEQEAENESFYDSENVGFDYERLRMINILNERSDWREFWFTIFGTRFMEVAVPDACPPSPAKPR